MPICYSTGSGRAAINCCDGGDNFAASALATQNHSELPFKSTVLIECTKRGKLGLTLRTVPQQTCIG